MAGACKDKDESPGRRWRRFPSDDPAALDGGEVLVGEGDRYYNIGFSNILVYHLALYVDARGASKALSAQESLKDTAGCTAFASNENLDSEDSECCEAMLHERFIHGRFRKVLRMVLWKMTWRERVLRALRTPLSKRVPADRLQLVTELVEAFPIVQEGDIVQFIFFDDGEQLEMRHFDKLVFAVRSTDLWIALQGVWLDWEAATPELRAGLLSGLPNVFLSQSSIQEVDANDDVGGLALRVELANARAELKTVSASEWESFRAGAVVGAFAVVLMIVAVSLPFHGTPLNHTAMNTAVFGLLALLACVVWPSFCRMCRIWESATRVGGNSGVTGAQQDSTSVAAGPGVSGPEVRLKSE
eukprot:TRINITY_DN8076_c0_g5_i1.p1 TRINITY_DN8076_c0_g5~~TRINITY_DN8076_c0_g5_i1.p1  ORF type:complete len:358 (-),score=53.09 TRINITY_DN8076_c0_g5_i1:78-1151(-)